MENILITGGAGFIGYHLAKKLIDENRSHVMVIDDFSRGKNDNYFKELMKNDNFKLYKADLSKQHELWNLKGEYDCIYHLAAINGTSNFYKKPVNVLEKNILSTMNLLNWINKHNCNKFVFSSTCETYYGTINKFGKLYLPTDEEVPLTIDDIYNTRTTYAISKIANESNIIHVCNNKNIPYNILRYHNIYGERMGSCHVIPEFIKKITQNKNILETKGINQTRSFMYIDDCIRDTLKVGRSEFDNEIFNIGIEKETKIELIAKKLIEYSGKELKIVDTITPKGSVERRLPNMNKFKEYFGKSKNVPLSIGLLKTYIWYKNNMGSW